MIRIQCLYRGISTNGKMTLKFIIQGTVTVLHRYELKNLTFRITQFRIQIWISSLGLDSEDFRCMFM